MPYPASDLLQNLGIQLAREFKRHWRTGSKELLQKLTTLVNKGLLPDEPKTGINYDISAIENFRHLNQLNKNRHKLIPLTPLGR
ncbi:hypothetical protein BGX26_008698, partial [Mortierella sp. AD094]